MKSRIMYIERKANLPGSEKMTVAQAIFYGSKRRKPLEFSSSIIWSDT